MNSSFLPGLKMQSLCQPASVGGQHGGVEKRTPTGTAHTAINRWGLPKLNEVNPMLTPLFYYCKPDAKKKAKPEAPLVLQQMNTFISRVAEGFQIRSLEQCERPICHCILCCRKNKSLHRSRGVQRSRLEKMILCSTYKEVSL